MNNYKVYVHINKVNGKRYYGITMQEVKMRWQNGLGYRLNEHFYRAIKKYGWNEGFEHIIIASGLSKEEAQWLEMELIREWNTIDSNYGYNNSFGGESNIPNEEARKKMSKAQSGENHPMYGKHHSDETKKKLSELLSGENSPMYGREFSEEHRRKIGESKYEPVYIIELDIEFSSVKECAEYLKCAKTTVSMVIRGENKTCKGYHIIYAKDKNNKEVINEVMKYEAKRGYKRQVYVIELDMTFDSITKCAEYLECDRTTVSKVLSGKNKTTKGYHIIYLEDKDKLDKKVS